MADNETIDVVATRVREHALKLIRDEYPYMKDEALQDIANSLQTTIREKIAAQEPVMGATKARISFCSLSAELRNTIYELALDINDQDPSRIVLARRTPEGRYAAPRLPALLRASRQVRSEAAPIYFGRNVFMTQCYKDSSSTVGQWLDHVGQKHAALIKRFVVRMDPTDDFFARALMDPYASKLITAGSAMKCLQCYPRKHGVQKGAIDVRLQRFKVRHRPGRALQLPQYARDWVRLRWVDEKELWNGTWIEARLWNGDWRYCIAIRGPAPQDEVLSTPERRREIDFKIDEHEFTKHVEVESTRDLE